MKKQTIPASHETRVTLICSNDHSEFGWSQLDRVREPIITSENPFQALQLLSDQGARYGWEVSRVIIDQDIAEFGFLEFLSQLPQSFRGDVLFIATDQRAFLSAVGRYDDRVLYALTRRDLQFYLETTLLLPARKLESSDAPRAAGTLSLNGTNSSPATDALFEVAC